MDILKQVEQEFKSQLPHFSIPDDLTSFFFSPKFLLICIALGAAFALLKQRR
jgi:hypothetical protein